MTTFTIVPRGPFALRELAEFGFGYRHDAEHDGVMRMTFLLDGGFETPVAVAVRQDDHGVHIDAHGDAARAAVERQVARLLSLDHDATDFVDVGKRDPVIGRLQAVAPGLRPPQFMSPYEAAAWGVVAARWSARQGRAWWHRFARAHGRAFTVAGSDMHAFPRPSDILALREITGLPSVKAERLRAVATTASEGFLEADDLRALEPDEARRRLQEIPGIGPFYSSLIVVRALGHADVPTAEPRALEVAAALYGLDEAPTEEQWRAMNEPWRPFRTWATVLVRAVGPRLVA